MTTQQYLNHSPIHSSLNRMVEVAKQDKAIQAGVLGFHLEALKNVPTMILESMSKLPRSPFNKVVNGTKGKVHISGPIQPQPDVNASNEAVAS